MNYAEFLSRVQEQGGLSSMDAADRAVRATLETLRDSLQGGSISGLPQELQQLLPAEITTASVGQWQPDMGRDSTNNPQIKDEARAASGGESTEDSGQ